jgi:DNA adenine methylase
MTNTYPGGKARLYQWLINHIPPHDTYIATHLGHDAILRFKHPARTNIGIDADASVIDWWQENVERRTGNVEQAPPRGDKFQQENRSTFYVPGSTFRFIHADAHQWLRYHAPFTGNDFVYSDPPYLFVTRKQRHRPLYHHEYTVAQHIDLLDLLKRLPCPVMLSGYESDIYNDLLAGWHTDRTQTTTRGGAPATEVIWMNYPPPTALHDYRYLGQGYRERERIKKLKRRWVSRWQNMDTLQRQAVLAAIQEANTS